MSLRITSINHHTQTNVYAQNVALDIPAELKITESSTRQGVILLPKSFQHYYEAPHGNKL